MRSLEDHLNDSAPSVPSSDQATKEALAELVAASRIAATGRKRRSRRSVLVGSSLAVVLAGGGAAAAAEIAGWNAPWADNPDGTLTFQLPSGGTCEQRLGDLKFQNGEAEHVIRTWLGGRSIADVVDVNAAIAQVRDEGPETHVIGNKEFTVGYGMEFYDPDYEYVQAVWHAEGDAITAKLVQEGFGNLDYSWAAELHCSGSNPNPQVPDFAK